MTASAARTPSIGEDMPSFCYADDKDAASCPPDTPETARTLPSHPSTAQTPASSAEVDPSLSRLRASSAQATADASPDQSVWQDGLADPTILYARNPFDVSLMAGNESTAHARTTFLRERNSQTGDLRLTGFDIVPPLLSTYNNYSQHSIGDQSFPRSVTDTVSSPSRSVSLSPGPVTHEPVATPTNRRGDGRRVISARPSSSALNVKLRQEVLADLHDGSTGGDQPGWQSSEPYTPSVAGWNKQSTDPLLPHGASSTTFASTGNLHGANAQDYRLRGASVDELMRITDEALVQAEAGKPDVLPENVRPNVIAAACLANLWLFWVSRGHTRCGCHRPDPFLATGPLPSCASADLSRDPGSWPPARRSGGAHARSGRMPLARGQSPCHGGAG